LIRADRIQLVIAIAVALGIVVVVVQRGHHASASNSWLMDTNSTSENDPA
jgi:hypothetical protein